jgi:hypothetical protein
MSRSAAIVLAIVLGIACAYLVGFTNGYAGCVAGASESFTNKMMRGQ